VPSAERAVEPTKHDQQDWSPAPVLRKRDRALGFGCRQLEIGRPVTRTEGTLDGIGRGGAHAGAMLHPRRRPVHWLR